MGLAAVVCSSCTKGSVDRDSIEETVEPAEIAPENRPDTIPFEQTPVGRHGHLSVQGTYLVDEHGQPVQLRGISSMWLNWENSDYALNFGGMQWMRDHWGITVFRAAMGVKDGDRSVAGGGYLSNPVSMERKVDTIIDNATRLGVYVLIDWHDHFATDSVEEAKDFFSRKAAEHHDNPSVIYETFNEPVPGDRATGDRFTWEGHIKPYHEQTVAAIREHDPDGVIVLGTPFWSQRVDEAAMDPVEGDNLMYALHFYSCTHDQWLRDIAQTALDAGAPLFVTEWGATDASGGTEDKRVCREEGDLWHELMDAHWISWAAWKLDDCVDASCLLASGAPRGGGWDDWLQGHGPYVVEKLLAPPLDPSTVILPASEPIVDDAAPDELADAGEASVDAAPADD